MHTSGEGRAPTGSPLLPELEPQSQVSEFWLCLTPAVSAGEVRSRLPCPLNPDAGQTGPCCMMSLSMQQRWDSDPTQLGLPPSLAGLATCSAPHFHGTDGTQKPKVRDSRLPIKCSLPGNPPSPASPMPPYPLPPMSSH